MLSKMPLWWKAATFVPEEDWEDMNDDTQRGSYLKVVVEVTERSHDGYCSGIEECEDGTFLRWYADGEPEEIEEVTYRRVGAIPLKDERGANWDFLCGSFDPGWGCGGGGSGVCGVRTTVCFVSMERVN